MAYRWLPNIEGFFGSLCQSQCSAQEQLESGKNGDFYYWCRRIQNYEPSLDAIVDRYLRKVDDGAGSRLLQNLPTLNYIHLGRSAQQQEVGVFCPQTFRKKNVDEIKFLQPTSCCLTLSAQRFSFSILPSQIYNFVSSLTLKDPKTNGNTKLFQILYSPYFYLLKSDRVQFGDGA